MKKGFFYLVFLVFLVSFVSAEIIIDKQPNELYNLGENMNLPVTITTLQGIYGFIEFSLICDGIQKELPKEEISLAANEAMKIEKSTLLMKRFIGDLKGSCQVKISVEGEPSNYILSDKFKISNLVDVNLEVDEKEFNPGDDVLVKGKAIKENTNAVEGFVEVNVITDDSSENRTFEGTVNNGMFSVVFAMPKNSEAGRYTVKTTVYEKDPLGEITNTGFSDFDMIINQVPTSLEIVFENSEVIPGENLRVKAVLHDQTGEKIQSRAIITIKDSEDKIFEQVEKDTNDFLEFPISYNQPSEEWKVVAVSNKLTAESSFTIIEKEDVKVEIINKTLTLTNLGNVPYNETLLIKIGGTNMNIQAYLEIDESKKYTLNAPDGEYLVEVLADGENKVSKSVALTGKVIEVKESSGVGLILRYPLAWIFVIFILGFISFIIFKRSFKKSFFGYITQKKNKRNEILDDKLSKKGNMTKIEPKNIAKFSLSIKGEKQSASVICLNIKNMKEIINEQSIIETMKKIDNLSNETKTPIHFSNNFLFFILSPSTTKTFKNEKTSVEIAGEIKKILMHHNSIFKPKIDFGISINRGEMITKIEDGILKFMSFGNLMQNSKKISSIASNDIYLSKEIRDKLMSDVKAERREEQGMEFYIIKEIKKGKEENKKFISDFIRRLEGKNDKKEETEENKEN